MKKAKSKLLGLLLAFVMVLGLMPTVAFAAGVGDVAQIGDTGYPTLTEAMNAAKAGDTVTLLENVSEPSLFSIDKAITLDLGGKKFTSTSTNFALWIKNNVTIQNGTIDAPNVSAAIYDSVHLTIGPDLVINTPNVGVVVKENGTVPAKVTVPDGGSLVCPDSNVTAILADKDGCVMDISGTVKADGARGVALQTNGTRSQNVINIKEGANVSAGARAVYFPSDGQVNISGGTVTGGVTGIEIRAGVLNMTGGVVKGNGNGAHDTVTVSGNASGTTTDGADIAVAKHTTEHDLIVTIKGGSLAGTTSIYESKPQGDASGGGKIEVKIENGQFSGDIHSEDCTEFISGGIFAEDPAAYVNPDVAFVKDSHSYAVGNEAVALVENATAGDTLTLIQYDSEITVPEGVEIDNQTGTPVTVNGNTVENAQQVTTTHNTVATDAKEATCTETGNIAYWYCTNCDKYYSDEACTQEIGLEDTVIAAKGHSETELKNVKEATCTAEGYTGDKVCKTCGEVVEAGKTVVKTAHTYKDGKCTVCGAIDPSYKPGTQQDGAKDPGYKPDTQPGGSADTDKDAPQTGDNINIALYFILMLAAGSGLTGTAIYSRKRKSTR